MSRRRERPRGPNRPPKTAAPGSTPAPAARRAADRPWPARVFWLLVILLASAYMMDHRGAPGIAARWYGDLAHAIATGEPAPVHGARLRGP